MTSTIRAMLAAWFAGTGIALLELRGPRWLAVIALLAGVANAVGVVVPMLGGLNIVLFPLWFCGTGIWLLGSAQARGGTSASA